MANNRKKWVDFKQVKDTVSMDMILKHYGLIDKFKRKGDNLVGSCPIHKGTNVSQFHVSLQKNNFNCFGDCHSGGNILDFVAGMEDVDIRAAALLIQDWFNIKPERNNNGNGEASSDNSNTPEKEQSVKNTKEEKKDSQPKEDKGEALYNKPLSFALKNLDQEHAYLKERGLDKETIQYFGLGFCNKGLMSGRVVIPVYNEQDELVAYAGRWPGDPPEGEQRYKLPPKFHKSLVVFNLHRAKDLARGHGLILVEGFFDCFCLWEAGFRNVVALMGSNLSKQQEDLIVDTVGTNGKVMLMFDEDEAGRLCRKECLEKLSPSLFVRVIELDKEGTQPDMLNEQQINELFISTTS